MSSTLDFKSFKASNNKVSRHVLSKITSFDCRWYHNLHLQVHLVDFHPVQPWLAMADKAGMVTVWNWSTEQASSDCTSMYSRQELGKLCCNRELVMYSCTLAGPIRSPTRRRGHAWHARCPHTAASRERLSVLWPAIIRHSDCSKVSSCRSNQGCQVS